MKRAALVTHRQPALPELPVYRGSRSDAVTGMCTDLDGSTSPVMSCLKFSDVFGAISANNLQKRDDESSEHAARRLHLTPS